MAQRSATLAPGRQPGAGTSTSTSTSTEVELAAMKELEAVMTMSRGASGSGEQSSGADPVTFQNPQPLKGQRFRKKHFILTLDGGGLHGVVSGTVSIGAQHNASSKKKRRRRRRRRIVVCAANSMRTQY